MNWEAVGAIAEALGAIGVIATLIALTIQLRQFSRSTRTASELDATDRLASITERIGNDPELMELWGKAGIADPRATTAPAGSLGEPLSPQQYGRVMWMAGVLFTHADAVYSQYRKGALDEEVWRQWEAFVRQSLASTYVYSWWWGSDLSLSIAFTTMVKDWYDVDPVRPFEGEPDQTYFYVANRIRHYHGKPLLEPNGSEVEP